MAGRLKEIQILLRGPDTVDKAELMREYNDLAVKVWREKNYDK